MGHFTPCAGNTACTEHGTHCRACGRSHPEITATRHAVDALAALALEFEYDNLEDFAAYVARRVVKKVSIARQRALEEAAPCL